MTLQDIVNSMNDAAQTERTKYHLTLGGLIEVLEDADAELPVEFEDGTSPGALKSYRGYYSDLAFSDTDETVIAANLLGRAREANGKTFTGYKGGDYVMNERTPLWRAEWGEWDGETDALMNAIIEEQRVVLVGNEE